MAKTIENHTDMEKAGAKSAPPARDSSKEQRLALALRRNLMRRKALRATQEDEAGTRDTGV